MNPTKNILPLLGYDWLEWANPQKAFHPGVDFGLLAWKDYGQDVVAAKSGFIEYINEKQNYFWSRGFGKFIIMIHDDGTYTRYAHLKNIGDVKVSKRVKKGDVIGYLGNTGTKDPHLHFEVFNKKLAEKQAKHWRKWCFYPRGQSKQFVMEHYLNPWEWLADDLNGIPVWAHESWKKAKTLGLPTDNPFEEIASTPIQKDLVHLSAIKETGSMPRYRWYVTIDKMGLL